MAEEVGVRPAIPAHGASRLPAVNVESYNVELKDEDGFVGDRASKGAFRQFIEGWRKPLRDLGQDPFGEEQSETLTKKHLDTLLVSGDREAAGIVQGAIESFAQELALVTRRFLKVKGWKDAERLVIGGGFSGSRVGELAIGRASVILKAEKIDIDIAIIRNPPDEAGLIGAVQLAPPWMFQAHDAILAVDIGGTNIRAGIVELNLKRAADLSKAKVWKFELWRHGDEKIARSDAVEGLVQMLERLIGAPKRRGCIWRRSSALAVPERSTPMARSSVVRRTCLAIGKAAVSIYLRSLRPPFRRSAASTPWSLCTTMRSCRVSAKYRRCRM